MAVQTQANAARMIPIPFPAHVAGIVGRQGEGVGVSDGYETVLDRVILPGGSGLPT